jgi:hypothetical protein
MRGTVRKFWRLALLLAVTGSQAPSRASETDEKDIGAVIESFRTAIIQHDKQRFLSLFVSPEVPWQGVLTDEGLVKLRHFDAHAAKVAYDNRSTPVTFFESLLRSKKSSEEKFSDIKIDTDGEVATARADYEFLSGEKLVNSGRECWLLVRTGAGWKITTLAFSSTMSSEQDPAKH